MKERCESMKRLAICALIGILALCLTAPAAASDEQLKQLTAEAMKNYEKFQSQVQDLTMVQESMTKTGQGDMEMVMTIMTKGDNLRVDNQIKTPQGEMKTVIIANEEGAWFISPFTGKKAVPKEKATSMQAGQLWWAPYLEKGELVGEEEVNGRPAYVIDLSNAPDAPFNRVWLDKEELIMLKNTAEDAQGKTMEVVFKDFMTLKQGDYKIPKTIVVRQNGQVAAEMKTVDVKVNQGLSDVLFDPDQVDITQQK
jgi:outer membrane lipoprotein-sorting protein